MISLGHDSGTADSCQSRRASEIPTENYWWRPDGHIYAPLCICACVCVCVPAALVPDIFRLLSVARGRHWPASQPDILWLVGTCWTFLAKQIFSKDFIFDYALGKMGRRCQKRTEVPSFKMRHLEQIVPLDFSGLLLQPNGRYVLIAKTSNPNMNKVIQLLLLFFDLSVMDGRHMASTQTLISSSDVIL